MWHCHYCRFALSLEVQKRNRLCPGCSSDLHCCKNCRNYDESTQSKCREAESPWVADRSAQNTCPFFEFAHSASVPLARNQPETTRDAEAEKAKEAFRALFRPSGT